MNLENLKKVYVLLGTSDFIESDTFKDAIKTIDEINAQSINNKKKYRKLEKEEARLKDTDPLSSRLDEIKEEMIELMLQLQQHLELVVSTREKFIPPGISRAEYAATTHLIDMTLNQDEKRTDYVKYVKKFECVVCGDDYLTKKCSRCEKVYYCSVKCQRKDWENHKPTCKNGKIS